MHPQTPVKMEQPRLFITGLLQGACSRGVGGVLRRALEAALGHGSVQKVVIASNTNRHLTGSATAILADDAVLVQALTFSGTLCISIAHQECTLTICRAHKDKQDHLFPQLDATVRSALQLDTVAVFSTTDG